MSDAMRVLYLIGQFPAINHNYLLAEINQLRSLGIDVAVASISPPDRPPENLGAQEREDTARTYYVKSASLPKILALNLSEFLGYPLRYLGGLFFALRLARWGPRRSLYHLAYFAEAVLIGRYMRQCDIVHVHANFSATVSLLVARTFPVTMSWVAHGFGELHDPSETHLAERVRGALFVRSVSRYGIGQLMLSSSRDDFSKLIYAPLGIDAAQFQPLQARTQSSLTHSSSTQSSLTILCAGRLSPEKGQWLLLEAIALLEAQGRAVHLRLAGDGPDRAWLEQRATGLGVASSVEFAGWVDPARMATLYSETDVFVLSSLAEGIPIVLMEAMAMQIPCVAPRIAGIPELIEDGVDGMLFTVADVEDIARKIGALLDSPELRTRIGARARTRVVSDYDIAENTKRFAAMLQQRLQKARPPK